MMRIVGTALAVIVTASSAHAAGTPFEEFQDAMAKKSKKSMCVCQDGGSNHGRAGRVSSTWSCTSGTCSVLTSCGVELYNEATQELFSTVFCYDFETIAK